VPAEGECVAGVAVLGEVGEERDPDGSVAETTMLEEEGFFAVRGGDGGGGWLGGEELEDSEGGGDAVAGDVRWEGNGMRGRGGAEEEGVVGWWHCGEMQLEVRRSI